MPEDRIAGTALVTGATGGIGGEIARALHAQGAHVVLSGTREAVLQEMSETLGDRVSIRSVRVRVEVRGLEEVYWYAAPPGRPGSCDLRPPAERAPAATMTWPERIGSAVEPRYEPQPALPSGSRLLNSPSCLPGRFTLHVGSRPESLSSLIEVTDENGEPIFAVPFREVLKIEP